MSAVGLSKIQDRGSLVRHDGVQCGVARGLEGYSWMSNRGTDTVTQPTGWKGVN